MATITDITSPDSEWAPAVRDYIDALEARISALEGA